MKLGVALFILVEALCRKFRNFRVEDALGCRSSNLWLRGAERLSLLSCQHLGDFVGPFEQLFAKLDDEFGTCCPSEVPPSRKGLLSGDARFVNVSSLDIWDDRKGGICGRIVHF